jgi:hypothetical protein
MVQRAERIEAWESREFRKVVADEDQVMLVDVGSRGPQFPHLCRQMVACSIAWTSGQRLPQGCISAPAGHLREDSILHLAPASIQVGCAAPSG